MYLKKLTIATKANWQETLTYPAMLFVWMLNGFFVPITMLLVWQSVATTNPDLNQNMQSIVNYYVLLPVIVMVSSSWHGVFLANRIRNGEFNNFLVKPIHHSIFDIANNLAEKITKLTILSPLVIAAFIIFPVSLPISPAMTLFFVLSIILAGILYFLVETIIGYLAFWLDDVTGIINLIDISLYTIGGRFVPLFLLPAAFQPIAIDLPFRYMHGFAAEILSGSLTTTQILTGYAIQSTWIIICTLAALLLWKKGVAKYAAIGG